MYSGLRKIRLGFLAVLFTHAEFVHFGGSGRDFIHFYFLFCFGSLSLPFTGF